MSGPEPEPARRWPVVLAWGLWGLAMLGLAATAWLDLLLRQAGRSDLATTVGAVPAILACVSSVTVGAVVASRRRHPVGWLLLALGVFLSSNGVTAEYAPYGLLARPGGLPAAGYVALTYPVTALLAVACVGFVLLLTPTGSLPSPRWRWWARTAAAAPLAFVLVTLATSRPAPEYQILDNPFDFRGLEGAPLVVNQVALAVTNLAVLVAAASLVVRFRRATGVERLRLRWVALAAALVSAAVVVALIALLLGTAAVLGWAAGITLAILPLAIGAAVLRYRLYDLDRIVSRTIAYGLLTVLLGAGYAGVVLGLGNRLGEDSPSLVVAGATLAVAAVFQPARRRVQDLVDRRFNRHRYDAERTIAAFSGRLRQQTDLDALTAELLAVVDQTVRPTRAALWLRPGAEPGRGGARVQG